jgi:hypothetical protein
MANSLSDKYFPQKLLSYRQARQNTQPLHLLKTLIHLAAVFANIDSTRANFNFYLTI